MKIVFTLSFLCFFLLSQAQIVNVENLRHEPDSLGWSGFVSLKFELQKNNTSNIFNIENQSRVQYKRAKSLWFLINDLSFKKVNSTEITNNSTQHLRYSHILTPKVSLESFFQLQRDRISEIELRSLFGTGLRFNVLEQKKYKFYFGTTFMYEYEHAENDIEDIQHNLRSSNYLSFKVKPNINWSVVSSNYYQPLYENLSDYRFLSETSILINLFKHLKLTTTFYYLYDAFPVINVSKEQYKLTHGLLYSFD